MRKKLSALLKFFKIQNLTLNLPSVRIRTLELPVQVLLELLHVEQLEGAVKLQRAVGKLEDFVANGCLLL